MSIYTKEIFAEFMKDNPITDEDIINATNEAYQKGIISKSEYNKIVFDIQNGHSFEQKLEEAELNVLADIALSGIECLEKVKSNSYDIIFMDIKMPEMDEVEAFHRLREMPGFVTPIVALTADAKTGAKEEYLSIGFDGYIAKPIHIEELKSILDQYRD